MKNTNKIVMVIMGTLIGAGFASGREIYIFFAQYGFKGLIGIIISGILTSFIIYRILIIIKDKPIYKYDELLKQTNKKYDKLNNVIKWIVNSFLLISFFIMVAAFSAYIKQNYNVSTYISSAIFVLISYIVFEKSLQGMMKINSIIVPILLIFILLIGIKNFQYINQLEIIEKENVSNYMFIFSSILYTSYNSIILIPVLVSMKTFVIDKNQIKNVSLICGITIILLSVFIYLLLGENIQKVKELEMPLIEIVKKFGESYRYIYSFIIIASIFTSAISAGYSFLKNVSPTEKSYKINLVIICIASIFVSKIGFTNLISNLYPAFGILGILQILLICFYI